MTTPDPSEVTLEWYKSNVQGTRELGMFALKTLVTLNSGAFVVLLTFVGNAAAQSAYTVPLEALRDAMYCFLVGITATFLVITLAYVNSMSFTPYNPDKGMGDRLAASLYVGGAAVALIAFISGVVVVISNVSASP